MPPTTGKDGLERSIAVAAGSPQASSSADRQSLWARIQENIKKRLGLQRYGIWFKQTELMRLDESSLVVGVPNVIIQQYLEQQYKATVREAAEELLGSRIEVGFDVAPNLLRKARAERSKEDAGGLPEEAGGTGREPRRASQRGETPADAHSFERLFVTEANRLPYLAAVEIASKQSPRFKFLLVLGDYGVGKTALLQATHRGALENRVAGQAECVVAEGWCNEYYYSLPAKTKAFRRRYRSCDLLLMDDVQFLQGKVGAQDELVHTLKSILTGGGRVVLSSTVHPRDLREVTPAFKTLVGGAFWVELIMPPPAERELIARHLGHTCGLRASSDVFRYLAQGHARTVQELNAAVLSLAAYAFLQGHKEVDLGVAKEALVATSRCRTRLPTLGDIERLVLEVFPVTEAQLKGKLRCRSVCRARQVGMYLARELTHESLSDIGRFFGDRTHSTVKHAVELISRQLESDQETASVVERCRRRLEWA